MFPMTTIQSWVFLILLCTVVALSFMVRYWREMYYEAQATHLYIRKLDAKKRTLMDDIYRPSFDAD